MTVWSRQREGDVIFTERGHWHGFDNTGDEDVTLVWGWSGAGSLEDAGYEVAAIVTTEPTDPRIERGMSRQLEDRRQPC